MEEETRYVTKTSPRGDKSIEKGRKWNPLRKNTDLFEKIVIGLDMDKH